MKLFFGSFIGASSGTYALCVCASSFFLFFIDFCYTTFLTTYITNHFFKYIDKEKKRNAKKQHQSQSTKSQVRNASVITMTHCRLLMVAEDVYHSLVVSHGYHFTRILNTCKILATPPPNRLKTDIQQLLLLSRKNTFLR